MASGQSKQNAINNATKKAVAASAPKSYSDPNGSFNGATGVYSPNQSATQLATQGMLDTGINKAVSNIAGNQYDVNSAFDNPYYQSTLSLLKAPVDRQYAQDQTALQNNLNAKGLTGGSYDAYSNNLLNQNNDYNQNQIQGQARDRSSNAYQQALQNSLAQLSGLSGERSAGLQREYQPFNAYTTYQNAINPGSAATAQAYMNQGNQLAQIPSLASTIADNAIWKPWQYTNQTLAAVRGGGSSSGNTTLQQGVK